MNVVLENAVEVRMPYKERDEQRRSLGKTVLYLRNCCITYNV